MSRIGIVGERIIHETGKRIGIVGERIIRETTSVAPTGGVIAAKLAGPGGLAGEGGLAGRSGGLAG